VCPAQDKATQTAPARTPADGPFVPAPALPGGLVLPLYPSDSPLLKRERIHEAERYNTSGKSTDKILKTLNNHNPTIEVHLAPAYPPEAQRNNTSEKNPKNLINTQTIQNPTIEVHLAPADPPNTGAAIIVA